MVVIKNETYLKVASFAWTMEQYAYEIPVLLFQLEAFQYLFEKQVPFYPYCSKKLDCFTSN